jgi:hypothetical protein
MFSAIAAAGAIVAYHGNTPTLSQRPMRFLRHDLLLRERSWKTPEPAAPRWPGVPGSAFLTSQMMLLSIWFGRAIHLHVNAGTHGHYVGEHIA